jgi:hypothetical protein
VLRDAAFVSDKMGWSSIGMRRTPRHLAGDNIMVRKRNKQGTTKVSLWNYHGTTRELLWLYHGPMRVLLWNSRRARVVVWWGLLWRCGWVARN